MDSLDGHFDVAAAAELDMDMILAAVAAAPMPGQQMMDFASGAALGMYTPQASSASTVFTCDSFDTTNPAGKEKKKRTRATPEQVAVLEEAFEANTAPSSKTRQELAARLGMPERSVQIWFQNRRAKVKALHKRVAQAALDSHALEEQQTFLVQMQQLQAYQQMMAAHRQNVEQLSPTGSVASDSVKFPCETLNIGSWRRIVLTRGDLVCGFDFSNGLARWKMADGKARFKIEFPLASISGISFEAIDTTGHVEIDVRQQPQFFMESRTGGADGAPAVRKWVECRDFTEGKQASAIFRHVLSGPLGPMLAELRKAADADARVKALLLTDLSAIVADESSVSTSNEKTVAGTTKARSDFLQVPQQQANVSPKRKRECDDESGSSPATSATSASDNHILPLSSSSSSPEKKQRVAYVSPPAQQKPEIVLNGFAGLDLVAMDEHALNELEASFLNASFVPVTPDDTPAVASKALSSDMLLQMDAAGLGFNAVGSGDDVASWADSMLAFDSSSNSGSVLDSLAH